MSKLSKTLGLSVLAAVLLLAFLNIALISAQSTGTVIILQAIGGSTSPSDGTYTYPDGSTQTFTATPDNGYTFTSWTVLSSGGSSLTSTNPLSLPIIAGVTYSIQPNFDPIQPAPGASRLPVSMANAAIVVVLPAAGGSVTPPPGVYAFDNATSFSLKATPDSGWQFSHWVISGNLADHGTYPFTPTPTDNPYNVNHGYGSTYNYQAVFSPVGASPGPSPTIPEYSGAAVIAVAALLVAIAIGTFAIRRRK